MRGDFSGDGNIKIFPVAKSTELLFLNDTDWRAFSDATGASYEDLSTIEGLVSTAETYYNWTDEQTPEKNDGRGTVWKGCNGQLSSARCKTAWFSYLQYRKRKNVSQF